MSVLIDFCSEFLAQMLKINRQKVSHSKENNLWSKNQSIKFV